MKGVTTLAIVAGQGEAISIHTPVKGVTVGAVVSGDRELISIHTPVKGVTVQTRVPAPFLGLFQSTHP